jgi:DNA primase
VELIRRIEGCSYAQAARHLRRLAAGTQPFSPPAGSFPHCSTFRPFTRTITLNPRAPFLQSVKGISVLTATHFEAGTTERSSLLKDTVAVRLHDLHGRPLGYCGRRLDPETIARSGKWRFPKNFPKAQVLYNAYRAAPFIKEGIIVVECPWAVMRLHQAGFPNAVAILGTTPSAVQIQWLSKAPAILLLLDGDAPGRKAASKIAYSISPQTNIFSYQLPEGLEPEDLRDSSLASLVRTHLLFS